MKTSTKIDIYTDGSANVKTRNGTCAFIVTDGKIPLYQSSFASKETTNNQMEILAVINALEWLTENKTDKDIVTIYMDSQYVLKGITEWISLWKRKRWITSKQEAVKNVDLWKRIDELVKTMPEVKYKWVKAHNGNVFNEMVDKLCTDTYKK